MHLEFAHLTVASYSLENITIVLKLSIIEDVINLGVTLAKGHILGHK